MKVSLSFAFLSSAALLPFSMPAQSTSPSEPATNSSAPSDDTIKLSAFEVSSKSVQGYATTSATSASRLAVPITELPNSVIVLNEKLISDLVAVDPEDALNLVGGVSAYAQTGSAKQNQFSMRGYVTSSAQRDGFTDLLYGLNGGFSFTFIDRIEVLKGPNGVLYGQNNGGGLINLVSKKPLDEPRTRITGMYGSYNFNQEDLDTSGFFDHGHEWGYRLSASYRNSDGPLNNPGDGNKGYYAINPTVHFRTKNGLEVWAWAGWVRDQSPRLNPIVRGFATKDGKGAYLMSLAGDNGAHNVLTNLANVQTNNYEAGATKSLTFGNVRLDVRLLARYSKQSDSGTLVRTSGLNGRTDTFVDKAGNIINYAPNTDNRNIDISVAEDNLGSFYRDTIVTSKTSTFTTTKTYATDVAASFDVGPTQHKLLIFGTYNPIDQDSVPGINGFNYTVSSAANLAALGVPIVNGAPRIYLYPFNLNTLVGISPAAVIKYANVISPQAVVNLNSDQFGTGAVERMNFLDNRGVIVAGIRYTNLQSATTTSNGAPVNTSDSSWTKSLGAVFKFYKGKMGEAALFVDDNQTFVPVYTIDRRKTTLGQKYPDNTIGIKEVGLKMDLFNSRVVGTVSLYNMKENNVLVPFIDETGDVTGTPGATYNVPSGDQTTHGWDADVSVNVARGFDIIASYGIQHGRLSDGHKPSGQPTANAGLLARYEVQSGLLKRASLAWSYTWWSDSILNSRTYWTVPPGYLNTAILGYGWKNITVHLRVENVFDHISLKPGTNDTAVGVTNPRNYRFSIDYIF